MDQFEPSKGAFPYNRYPPPGCCKSRSNNQIALQIGRELFLPKIGSGGRSCRVSTVRVSVPETPMHEDDSPVLWEGQIRTTHEVTRVETVPQAMGMQGSTQGYLGLGVLAPDPRHHS